MLSAASAAILTKLLILPPDRPSVYKGELGAIKRVVWSNPLDLARIKAVGKGLDATINDVLVSAMAGALREYMVHGAATIPTLATSPPWCRSTCARRPPKSSWATNSPWSTCRCPSACRPHRPLTATKHHMDVLKKSPEPFIVYQILGLVGSLPLDIAKQVTTWFSTKASMVFTNVPGPRQQLYFAGTPLKSLMFWVPQSGEIGLGISIISYNGAVMVGLMVDDNLIKEPQVIMDRFAHQFDLLTARAQHSEQDDAGRQSIPITQTEPAAPTAANTAAPTTQS
jgi:diacylglycerol O-acyltransferase